MIGAINSEYYARNCFNFQQKLHIQWTISSGQRKYCIIFCLFILVVQRYEARSHRHAEVVPVSMHVHIHVKNTMDMHGYIWNTPRDSLHKKLSRAHIGDTLVSLEARIGTWHGVTYQNKNLFQGLKNQQKNLSLVPRGLFFNGTSVNYAETVLVIPFAVKLVLVSLIWAFSDTLFVLLTAKNKIFIFHLNFLVSPLCLYHNIFRITVYVSTFVSVFVPMSLLFNSNRFGQIWRDEVSVTRQGRRENDRLCLLDKPRIQFVNIWRRNHFKLLLRAGSTQAFV